MTKKKPTKRIKPIVEPAHEQEESPVQAIQRPLYLPYVVTAVFFILSLIGIFHHEMWRDEFQAWMVARDAHSIAELFQNLKYEGNPVLWHAFLFIITAFTDEPMVMQVFHILISTTMVYVINRHAPMTLLQKLLLTFSYFVFYEYNIISRSYGLGMLLVVGFLALYPHRAKYIWWMAGMLFLLANCTIFGVILAGALCAYLVADAFFARGKRKKTAIPVGKLLAFAVVTGIGMVLGYVQIAPEPNNTFPTVYMTSYDTLRVKEMFSRIMYAYFPVPDFTDPHWWNSNLFVRDTSSFSIGLSIMPLLVWLVLFWKNKLITLLFAGVTMVLLVFYYYTGLIWSRYAGHLFVILLACYWLLQFKEGAINKEASGKFSGLLDKLRAPVMTAFLAISAIGGVISYVLDWQQPFSTSSQAATYLKENKLDEGLLIGLRDYTISPLATHLDRKLYYAERNEAGTFIIYDEKRIPVGGIRELVPLFKRFYNDGYKQMVLVKDNPIMLVWDDTGEKEPWTDAMLTEHLNLRLLTHVEPGVVKDEDYYIYVIEEKLKEQ